MNINFKTVGIVASAMIGLGTILTTSYSFAVDEIEIIAKESVADEIEPLKRADESITQSLWLMQQQLLRSNERQIDFEIDALRLREQERPLTSYESSKLDTLTAEKQFILEEKREATKITPPSQ